jgi:D-alanine-D-alanine ligase
MKIGLTYDLRDDYLARGWSKEDTAEFDSMVTIDAIADVLTARGHEVVRIGGIEALAEHLVGGGRPDWVFNIAEGVYGTAREAQVPALLDAYRIPYCFSDAATLALCLHKGMAKHVVRDAAIATPDFAVLADEADLRDFALSYPVFVKPVAEGTGKGIDVASRVCGPDALGAATRRIWKRFQQAAIAETWLPGRELTVGIVGTGTGACCIGVLEVDLEGCQERGIYSYDSKAHYEGAVAYRLADDEVAREAAETALAAWRVLGCRDGGRIDLRCDGQGRPNFLEANPLAGLHPVDSDLVILARLAGMAYDQLIGAIVESALLRHAGGCRATSTIAPPALSLRA